MKFHFLVLLAGIFCISGNAQGFKGSAIVGGNFAQLDGDRLVGYRKLGLSAGMKVSFDLVEKLGGNIELLYSQRGSATKLFPPDNEAFTLLNYMELPIYVSIRDWYIPEEKYHKLSAHLGLSLGYLISSKVREQDYVSDWLRKQDLSYIIGANYAFTKNLSVSVRYTRSINKILDDPTIFERYLLGYFWTIRTEYTF